MSDLYATLGLDRNASPEDIKQAYRKMAAKHHPDRGGDTATFQKVQQAYETLSDPQKRQQYDNPNPFNGMQGAPGGFHFNFGGPGGFHFTTGGMDINDIFGQMFGGPSFRQQTTYRTQVFVTLEQVYNGEEHIMNLNTPQGFQTIKIEVPKGIQEGGVVKYDNIIQNGILMVEFRTHPHPRFEREGNNLYSVQEINLLDLIVGSSFKFTTISGKVIDVMIKEKTQPNAKIRIQGEGMINKNGSVGDQYILLKPFIPDMIDSRIIDSIKNYK